MWLSGRHTVVSAPEDHSFREHRSGKKKIPTSTLCHLFHCQNRGMISFQVNDSYIQVRNISLLFSALIFLPPIRREPEYLLGNFVYRD